MIAVAWFVVMNGPESSATYSARSLHGLEPCSVLPPQVPVLEARVRSLSHITPIDSSVCCHDPDAPVPRAMICSGALPDMPPGMSREGIKKERPPPVCSGASLFLILHSLYYITEKSIKKYHLFQNRLASSSACPCLRFMSLSLYPSSALIASHVMGLSSM